MRLEQLRDGGGMGRWVCAAPLLAMACGEPAGPRTDLRSPVIQILSPRPGAYDSDGDGLVDFSITFSDVGAGIDPATLSVVAEGGTMHGAAGENLLEHYTVSRLDSAGLVMEELPPRLLHEGLNRLTLRVRDRRGNEAVATTEFELPAGAYHTTLDLELDPTFNGGEGILVLPDGSKGYVIYLTHHITVFDPDSLRVLKQVSAPFDFGQPELSELVYDEQRQLLYLSSDNAPVVMVLDPRTDEVVDQIPLFTAASTLGLSRLTPELYAGLQVFGEVNGFVSVVDRDLRHEVAVINTGVRNRANPGQLLVPTAAVLNEDESKLYLPTLNGEGILVIDPRSRNLLQQIDLDPDGDSFFGVVADAVRVGDLLYLTLGSSTGSFLSAFDTRTDTIVRKLPLAGSGDLPPFGSGKRLAASPSGRRLFLTARDPAGFDLLVEAASLRPLARFDGPIVTEFSSFGVSFHPDGTRVYVIDSDNDVDVFMNRE